MSNPIITLINLYQRTASTRVRRSCRFEPSCSNYMIESINKYGTILGLGKGINRLIRCRPPNGGVDKP